MLAGGLDNNLLPLEGELNGFSWSSRDSDPQTEQVASVNPRVSL